MRRRTVALASVALVVLAHWNVVIHGAAEAQDLSGRTQATAAWTPEKIDAAALFDAVVDAVKKHFFDADVLRQINWPERAAAARVSVLSSPTTEDAVRQINKLLAGLGASHTALYTPDDYQYYVLLDVIGTSFGDLDVRDLMSRRFWGSGPYYPGIGMFTRDVDGRHFVDGVLRVAGAERRSEIR